MVPISYSELMKNTNSYISINLNLKEPVEIGDFAAMFAGVGMQFDRHLSEHHPELKGKAKMYIREVRKGSIVADIFANIPDLVGYMDTVLIVAGFGSLFSKRVSKLIKGQFIEDATKSDISELGETIRAVSHDNDGEMTIETVTYQDGVWNKKLEIKFSSSQARKAVKTLDLQKSSLDKKESVDHERVLMVFTRSDIHDAKIGKGSGDRVVIEELSDKPLALTFASDLAQKRIKHEIREADDNLFKKGFVVDVNVQLAKGNPVAYSVKTLHQVIDLPSDT
ncbi:hypothetical protein MNBD_ALPHA12-698 [hydrothermal vent metagenome]|uniref:Uncharacterized protein n=1 Tax=hydrothermal vent metagenome TaxID=652676 RepID=A0A3B0TPF9_9ZZZZ